MNTPKTKILKLTSAIAIGGEIVRAGELVEVTSAEAANLVQRGRAIEYKAPLTDDDAVTPSGTQEPTLHPVIAAFNADQADQATEREADAAVVSATTDAAGDADADE